MNTLHITNGKVIQIPNIAEDFNVGKVIRCESGKFEHKGKECTVWGYTFLIGVETVEESKVYHTLSVIFYEGKVSAIYKFEDFDETEYTEILNPKNNANGS